MAKTAPKTTDPETEASSAPVVPSDDPTPPEAPAQESQEAQPERRMSLEEWLTVARPAGFDKLAEAAMRTRVGGTDRFTPAQYLHMYTQLMQTPVE